MEGVDPSTAAIQERTDVIGKPESAKNVRERLGIDPGQIAFGDKQRNIFGHAVFAPDFHDASDELWLVVEIAPLNFTGLERIVLEREEGELIDGVVGFQIVDEAAGPGSLAGGVGPHLDVFVDVSKKGATE